MKPTLTPLVTSASQKAAAYYGHQTATQDDLSDFYALMTSPSHRREEYVSYSTLTDVGNNKVNLFSL